MFDLATLLSGFSPYPNNILKLKKVNERLAWLSNRSILLIGNKQYYLIIKILCHILFITIFKLRYLFQVIIGLTVWHKSFLL
jgi:hypothetical protein